MNDAIIENILFHAPTPVAPPDLLQRLHAEITLKQARSEPQKIRERPNPLRRWFPALAFSVLMLSCAIMIAVQGTSSANLKRQNATLRASTANLPQLREQHAAWEQARAQQDELGQLRKDNQELHQLRAEAARLQTMTSETRRLQNENQQLTSALSAPAPAVSTQNFFDDAQRQAERIQCANNLKKIGVAALVWGGDYDDKLPTSLVLMSNELKTVKFLICPSDKSRANYASLSFVKFRDSMSSYQYLAQPDDESFPNCVLAFCPIHHNYLLADGSVQMIDPTKVREVKKDGRLYLEKTDGTPFR